MWPKNPRRTFLEKEKMLVTSIFSSSDIVFKGIIYKVVQRCDCVVKSEYIYPMRYSKQVISWIMDPLKKKQLD